MGLPDRPVLFSKPATAVVGPEEPIRHDGNLTQQLDWECELAVVIGRTASRVSAETTPGLYSRSSSGSKALRMRLRVKRGSSLEASSRKGCGSASRYASWNGPSLSRSAKLRLVGVGTMG